MVGKFGKISGFSLVEFLKIRSKFDKVRLKFSKVRSNLSKLGKKRRPGLNPVPRPQVAGSPSPSSPARHRRSTNPSIALFPVAPQPSPAAILPLSGAFARRPARGKPPPPRSSIPQPQPLFFHAASRYEARQERVAEYGEETLAFDWVDNS
jgi:hypothetical protein